MTAEHAKYTPPNGGTRAWCVVAGSFLLQMSSFGYINACGVFQYYYQDVLLPDRSSQQLGWITTMEVFFLFALGMPIGKLVDTYGARPVIAPFAAAGVLALGLLSLCTEYYQVMLCQGVLFGLACSGTTLPAVVSVSQWFSSRRGLAVGLASCGSSFGGVVFPIIVSRIVRSRGFPAAVRWSALVVGVSMACGVLLCDSPFPPKRGRDRVAREVADREATDCEAVETSEKDQQQDKDRPAETLRVSKSLLSGLRYNGVAWGAFVTGAFFCMFSIIAPINYLPEMGAESGMSTELAQYSLAIANAGSMVGRVVPGLLSDKFGQFNVLVVVTIATAVSMLAFWLPIQYHPSNAAILVFGAVYGFLSGGFVSLLSPCVVVLAGGRLADLGVKMGVACVFLAIGALVGIPILGTVRDSTHSFQGLIGLSGATVAVGSFFFLYARIKMGGWKIMKKV